MLYPWALRSHINVRSLVSWQARADTDGIISLIPQAAGFLDDRQLRRLKRYASECDSDTELWQTGSPSSLTNVPLALSHQIGFVLAQRFQRDDLHIVQLLQLDEQLRKMMEAAVEMERIVDTAIPTAYSRHMARFLSVWLCFLPAVLEPSVGLLTPCASLLIAYFVLGMEDVGAQMENPFYVLPQVEYCMQANNTLRTIMQLNLADQAIALEEMQEAGCGPVAEMCKLLPAHKREQVV